MSRLFAAALAAVLLAGCSRRDDSPDLVPSTSADAAPRFSGEAAFAHVERQVAMGPRIPGSPGHRAFRTWLRATMDSLGLPVQEQAFRYTSPRDPELRYDGVNVVVRFRPEVPARVLLAAHYDTRAVADEDPDPARRTQPVPGANDGGSGVAVLVEIARLLATEPPPQRGFGIDLVFFDVEDAGEQISDAEATRLAQGGPPDTGRVPFAIGSAAFVASNPGYRPQFGIVVDMVGDRRLRIPREGYSMRYAGPVVDEVWAAARRAGATVFADSVGAAVEDDHIAFLQRGIPVIDLIHTPFPDTWHTTADTPEHVAPESLRQVGQTLVELLWTPAEGVGG